MKKPPLVNDEFYHAYNRGVDKRSVFTTSADARRFLKSIVEFNRVDPIGSIFENSFLDEDEKDHRKLVSVIAYCLNPNHYHLILKQLEDDGVSEFMKRLNGGYTMYFNLKHKRSGSLFQGTYKVKHISDNNHLLHLSAYVNLNDRVHKLGGLTSKLVRSSWLEYSDKDPEILCDKDIILSQFENSGEYEKFAVDAIRETIKSREEDKEWGKLLLE